MKKARRFIVEPKISQNSALYKWEHGLRHAIYNVNISGYSKCKTRQSLAQHESMTAEALGIA